MMEQIKHMLKVEDIEEDVEVFVNNSDRKVIIKNKNDELTLTDFIGVYLDVKDYNYIQEFSYLHHFNDVEIIEFILN